MPVALLVAIGFIAGRARWIRAEATKDLSNLVFVVLTPALMFRTMGTVHVEQLDFRPLAAYFVAVAILFAATLLLQGFNRRAAVAAGQAGQRHLLRTVLGAVRNAVIHPVPLPIIAGLLFAQTGWVIPEAIDKPLQWLGNAFGPLALLLVGVTLAGSGVGAQLRGAFGVSLVKNLLMPALVALLGTLFGLSGLPLLVMVVTAALPIGANVFLFSQRYAVAEELVTASVMVSNALALLTLPLVMLLAGRL